MARKPLPDSLPFEEFQKQTRGMKISRHIESLYRESTPEGDRWFWNENQHCDRSNAAPVECYLSQLGLDEDSEQFPVNAESLAKIKPFVSPATQYYKKTKGGTFVSTADECLTL